MENKQIALLNVLSSLGSNGGCWQRRGALTHGIQLQSGNGDECDVSALSCWESTKQIGQSNHRELSLLIVGPNFAYSIQMRAEPLPQLIACMSAI